MYSIQSLSISNILQISSICSRLVQVANLPGCSRIPGALQAAFPTATAQHIDDVPHRPVPPLWLPKCIVLLRHAQSADLEASVTGQRIPNHKIPLTELGVQQSLEAAQKLHNLMSATDPDYSLFIYSSPYERSVQTVRVMLEGLPRRRVLGFQEEVQLREQDWGNFQDVQQQRQQQQERLAYGRFFYRFPAGESVADVYDRVTSFQDHLVRDLAGGRWGPNTGVVLATHGLTLRVFLMRWLHWTVDEFLQVYNAPNAEPIVLERISDLHALPRYESLYSCGHNSVVGLPCATRSPSNGTQSASTVGLSSAGVDGGASSTRRNVSSNDNKAETARGDSGWRQLNGVEGVQRVEENGEGGGGKVMIHTKAFYRLSNSSQRLLSGVSDDMCYTSYCRLADGPRDVRQPGGDWFTGC